MLSVIFYLSNSPGYEKTSVLRVGQHPFGGVKATKVGGPVDDDSLDGHSETFVQTGDSVRLEHFGQTVSETVELPSSSGFTDIGGQSINDAKSHTY